LLVVAHAEVRDTIRIITSRLATREELRAPNIMKHTLRCHGFGNAGPAALPDLALGMRRAGSRGPKPCQPARGCGQNRR
jgi:hypothetical protein